MTTRKREINRLPVKDINHTRTILGLLRQSAGLSAVELAGRVADGSNLTAINQDGVVEVYANEGQPSLTHIASLTPGTPVRAHFERS